MQMENFIKIDPKIITFDRLVSTASGLVETAS
jgi:hypothetical protein